MLLRRFGNSNDAMLKIPAKNNLRHGFAMRTGNFFQNRLIQQPSLHERRPGFQLNALLACVAPEILLRQIGMKFNLVDHGFHFRICQQVLQMMNLEIAHPDRPDATLPVQLLQSTPGILVLPGHRPVDQVQIEVLQAKPFQTCIKSR
ncbi:hypothetical protein D3C71_1555190 [compost metagenome]